MAEKFETELQEVLQEEKRVAAKKKALRGRVIAAMREQCCQFDITAEDLFPAVSKVEPVYCNPENRSETWTGRGRKPHWFQEHIEAGYSSEDMRISEA